MRGFPERGLYAARAGNVHKAAGQARRSDKVAKSVARAFRPTRYAGNFGNATPETGFAAGFSPRRPAFGLISSFHISKDDAETSPRCSFSLAPLNAVSRPTRTRHKRAASVVCHCHSALTLDRELLRAGVMQAQPMPAEPNRTELTQIGKESRKEIEKSNERERRQNSKGRPKKEKKKRTRT